MGKSKKKVTKKALFQNIETTIIKELKKSTSEIVKNSKKFDKLIKKETKKLVKKLSKRLKVNKSVLKSIDLPSVSREVASTSNTPKAGVAKRVRTRPSAKVPSPVSTSAGSSKSSTNQSVKKTTATPRTKVTE